MTTAEPSGANCSNGGQRLDVGVDSDDDGTLADEEIDSTVFVCRQPYYLAISSGSEHICAVVNDGAVECWGKGYTTESGGEEIYKEPLRIGGIDNAIAITSGDEHTCALLSDHTARCWGDNSFGQLGNTTDFGFPPRRDYPAPWHVLSPNGTGMLEDISSIVAGSQHTCAVANGRVYCWGWNSYGILGRGPSDGGDDTPIPAAVVGSDGTGELSGVSAISAGLDFNCAVVEGQARCWGADGWGQLGDLSYVDPEGPNGQSYSSTPVDTLGEDGTGRLTGVTAIASSANHSCAIVSGRVLCWGFNAHAQLGSAPEIHGYPFAGFQASAGVPLSGVKLIATGRQVTCAVLEGDQNMLCWGDHYSEADENGHSIRNGVPTVVPESSGVAVLSIGSGQECTIHRDGSARCW